ncbi:Uncharacterised protein [uncultured archaeon]|nr:Uncharacterised protein [uncultured archaeon]
MAWNGYYPYSYLRGSTSSSFAAFLAGTYPAATPTRNEKPTAPSATHQLTLLGTPK